MRIRTATAADAEAIARVQVDTWRDAYRGLVPDAHLAALSCERIAERQREHAAVPGRHKLVAEEEGRVVGFAFYGAERSGDPDYDGELHGLYVLPAFQRRGVGRALLDAVRERLAGEGYRAMLLWTLRDNAPARRFYEALGGRLVREGTVEIGGVTLPTVGYGWAGGAV